MKGVPIRKDKEGAMSQVPFFQKERRQPFFNQSQAASSNLSAVQAKFDVSEHDDSFEMPEAVAHRNDSSFSGESSLPYNRTPVIQRKCDQCEKEEEENNIVQKQDESANAAPPSTSETASPASAPAESAGEVSSSVPAIPPEAAPTAELNEGPVSTGTVTTAAPGVPVASVAGAQPPGQPASAARFIVEDTAVPTLTQMKRTEFLSRLKQEVRKAVNESLTGTPFSADISQYIEAAFAPHINSNPTQLEELIQRYAPAAGNARNAEEVIHHMRQKFAAASLDYVRRGGNTSGVMQMFGNLRGDVVSGIRNLGQGIGNIFFNALPGGANPPASPLSVMQSLGRGNTIPGNTKASMESAFGSNFSDVEIHTDTNASNLSKGMNARAFTVGNHIAFGPGQFQPGTIPGDALMAHELAHVNQQKNTDALVNHADNALEEDADLAARDVLVKNYTNKNLGPVGKGRKASKSGLRISRCNNSTPTPTPSPPPTPAPPVLPSEFQITGLPDDTGSMPNRSKIYFDRNSSTLAPSEDSKLNLIASTNAANAIDLHAYKSEDETTANLVDQRKSIVDTQLGVKGHTATRNPFLHPDAGIGDIDYRHKRLVEIRLAGGTPSTSNCADPMTGARLSPYVACTPASQFSTAQAKARQMLTNAITVLSGPLSPAARAALTRFFGATAATMPTIKATVRQNLTLLRSHVMVQMNPVSTPPATPSGAPGPGHICANDCNSTCAGTIAYNNGRDAAATMTLCPSFITDPNVTSRGETLIHEGLHGITLTGVTDAAGNPTNAQDFTYEWQRLINHLDTNTALKNNDSYVLFIRQMLTPGTPVEAGQPAGSRDTMTGFVANSTEEQDTKVTIAWLEGWLEKADQDVSSTYSTIVESIPAHSWTNGYYERVMGYMAPRFGMTAPPSIPTILEQQQVAGISDRYQKLRNTVSEQLTITRSPMGTTSWSAGPGVSLTVGADFFAAPSRRAKLDLLLRVLVEAHPGIPAAHRTHYIALVNELRTLGGRGSP
jgi:hypothetical protein